MSLYERDQPLFTPSATPLSSPFSTPLAMPLSSPFSPPLVAPLSNPFSNPVLTIPSIIPISNPPPTYLPSVSDILRPTLDIKLGVVDCISSMDCQQGYSPPAGISWVNEPKKDFLLSIVDPIVGYHGAQVEGVNNVINPVINSFNGHGDTMRDMAVGGALGALTGIAQGPAGMIAGAATGAILAGTEAEISKLINDE